MQLYFLNCFPLHFLIQLFLNCFFLYLGHLVKGNYNCTSLGEEEELLRQVDMEEDVQEEPADVRVDDRQVVDVSDENNELLPSREEKVEASSTARLEQERRRKKDEQEEKRPKKSSRVETMMEKYLEMRTKQVEDERSQLCKEKEATQGDDFSIKRCVSVLNTMDVTKEEKVKAYGVFKSKENREIFLSAWSEDQEASLMWLRNELT
jgi:hypothetical protein